MRVLPTAGTAAIRTDGARVAATMLAGAASRERPGGARVNTRDRRARESPVTGLHRQLRMLEETRSELMT